jgi:N-acetylneuraminic acid mutarotase
MRLSRLLPLLAIGALLIGLPLVALTDTGAEDQVRDTLGLDTSQCDPIVNDDSRWQTGPALAYDRDEPRTAVIDGKVYLVGGVVKVEHQEGDRLLLTPTADLTRFDPRTGGYEELAPLPRPLNHVGAAAYKGDLYVLGGYQRRVDADTKGELYRYDPATDRWSRLHSMPEPRAAMAVGVVGDQMIVAGGARDRVPDARAFAYDFRTRRWSRLPDMPSQREHVGEAVVDGKLYVLGGRAPQSLAVNNAERYDPATRRWERLDPLPVPVGGLAGVDVDGKVVAIGGGDDGRGTVSGAVQEFDPATGEWTRLPDMHIPRHGHGAAAVDGRLYAFGGSHCAYFNPTDDVESLGL